MAIPKNIAQMFTDVATSYSNKKYLFYKGKKYKYKDVESITNKISRVLHTAGVKKGDRVAIMLENSPYFIFSFFAVIKAGGVVVPVNTFLKDKEVSYIVGNCEAKVFILSESYKSIVNTVKDNCNNLKLIYSYSEGCTSWGAKSILEYADTMSDKPLNLSIEGQLTALIIYTSGTTGRPKGAMLTHTNLLSLVVMASQEYEMSHKDRFLLFLPMFHIYSLEVCIMFPTFLGGSIVILESVMDLKQKKFRSILIFLRPSIMAAVPTVYSALAKAHMPKWFIKLIYPIKFHLSSGSGLPVEVFNAFRYKYGKPLIEGYGLSECSPVLTGNPLDNPKAGSVGKPLGCVQIKIVNDEDIEVPTGTVGEIIAQGPNIMQGYWKMPKETSEVLKNGWFFTGDLGYLDEDGYLTIVDRKKDLILVKGMNVYPREVEEFIYQVSGVEAAAVIGIPSESGDEIIIAYVKPTPDSNLTEKAIKSYLKANIANFKIPKHIYFSDELPLTTIGKVLKRKLKEMVLKGQINGLKSD